MKPNGIGRKIIQGCLVLMLIAFGWNIRASEASASAGMLAATAAATTPAGPTQVTDTTLMKTAPADLLQSVDLRVRGGSYPGCLDQPAVPELDYMNDNLQLTDIAMIATCGWKPNETVKVTLMDPQGKFSSTEAHAVPSRNKPEVYEIDIYFQPGMDAPEGKYRFTFQGSATVKAKVTYTAVKGAKLYALPENRFQPMFRAGGKARLQLYGFRANEPVRLFVYQDTGALFQFYGWQDVKTDSKGRLVVEANLTGFPKDAEAVYYAYGLETHTVAQERFTWDGFSKTRQFNLDLYCPGALTPRLTGVEKLKAIPTSSSIEVQQHPGFGSRTLAKAASKAQVQVYGYPKCSDHAFWWPVKLSDPALLGWVSESRLGAYVVESQP